MKRYCLAIACLTAIPIAVVDTSAFGHGFTLSLSSGNLIEGSSGGSPANLFTHSLNNVASAWFSDHGSVTAKSGSAYIAPFDEADSFSIEFVGPLWYSNGNGAIPAPSGTLTAESFSADPSPTLLGQLAITGASHDPAELPVSGASTHSIGWTLTDISLPTDAGAYGIAYRVKGLNNGNPSTPFLSSEPLVVIFHTSGLSLTDLENAQQAIYQSAVPEPGTIGLALAGVALLAGGCWWRRRRQEG